MHKVLDSFLVKLPIDTQNGVAPKVCDPPIIPHFCGFVNRQNAQKISGKPLFFLRGCETLVELHKNSGLDLCTFHKLFVGLHKSAAESLVHLHKKEKPPN